jgi:hypothetical protein
VSSVDIFRQSVPKDIRSAAVVDYTAIIASLRHPVQRTAKQQFRGEQTPEVLSTIHKARPPVP